MLLTPLLALLPFGASVLASPEPFPPQQPRQVEADSLDATSPQKDWEALAERQNRHLCYVLPDKGHYDAETISNVLNGDCRHRALVVLPGEEYHMNTPLTTTDLDDIHIHLFGRLLWSPDIPYWLSVSMPIGFQNQSTVWYFGGDRVHWDGHGTGTLDGNGQVWYDWAKGEGNLPHRPMMINWRHLTNSVVRRTRFVQSQMWTMATSWSRNILFEDIYVNNTSSSEHSTLNTDGVDTINSDNITFCRWDVTCGDDNIALKGNSSNIFVHDSVFHGGQGLAIGSLGQYNGRHEHVDNFYARNVTMHNTRYAIYLKTWPGHQNGWPPNGGGGGLGHGKDIAIEDIVLNGTRTAPFWIWQCEHYEGDMGKDCDSSQFSFSDIAFRRVSGTTAPGVTLAASLRCAAGGGGCTNVAVEDFSVTEGSSGEPLSEWYCANVHGAKGFECEPFPPEEEE
jgi:hypothetical protein